MSKIIKLVFIVVSLLFSQIIDAKPNTNDPKARELFNTIYDMVYGPQGSVLSYNVNIVGIYKTNGTIITKGKKSHYRGQRVSAWEDGTTTYKVNTKQREVHIYNYNDEEKDKHRSKFKFTPDNYNYTYTTDGNYYIITATNKQSSFFGIKWIKIKANKNSLYPESLTIKMGIIRTTVKISNFRTGKIADSNFVFPHEQYKSYKVIDHR